MSRPLAANTPVSGTISPTLIGPCWLAAGLPQTASSAAIPNAAIRCRHRAMIRPPRAP